MFCWGDGASAQLGLRDQGGHRLVLSEPREIECLRRRAVKEVCCGDGHSVYLLADGTVFSSGVNGKGQLGRKRSECPLAQISALNTQKIVRVACGKLHTLALCENGSVFGWGAGTYGQLGNGDCQRIVSRPRRVEGFRVPIVQITCGRYHSLALSRDSAVYSWGQNSYGQLGLGEGIYTQLRPQRVTSLTGIPVAQIAAGGRHSFALSLSGAVFGWGKNDHGQLGLKDTENKVSPCRVKQLKKLNATYISCGNQHTAVLTKDGNVFTCGDGSSGQLGLSATTDVTTFQKVEHNQGEVSQIACGSYHTIAYIPSSDLVVSFGFAIQGTLENDSTRSRVHPESQNAKVHKIFAGANINFIQTRLPLPAADFRLRDSAQQILTMDETLVDKWINTAVYSTERKNAEESIALVFSSSSCLTGSFLRKSDGDQRKMGSDLVSVDVEAASEIFGKLTAEDWIVNRITSSLATKLLPNLSMLRVDKEALMIYLILPECSVMQQEKNIDDLVLTYTAAIAVLDNATKSTLGKCWSTLKSSALNNLVQMVKALVVVLLTGLQGLLVDLPMLEHIIPIHQASKYVLHVLELLYDANLKAPHNIPLNTFYIDELPLLFDLGHDLWRFRKLQREVPDELEKKNVPLVFCCYPFILNLNVKLQILDTDSVMKKKKAFIEAMDFTWLNIQMGSPEPPKYPKFILKVNRQDLAVNTFKKLKNVDEDDLKKDLVVKFDGELGMDLGAVRQEFFLSVFKELIHPDSGMFSKNVSTLWFPSKISVPIENYFLFGILCGLVVYNFSVVYIPFPLVVFKKLLNVKPTLEDLKELDPENTLACILDGDEDQDLGIDFVISWDGQEVELIPNGNNQPVTKENREEFVEAYVKYIFTTSVKKPFDEFRRGFYKVCDKELIKFFQPQELMDILIGSDDYDWNVLEENTTYEGIYSRTHPTIQIFWTVFHELTLDEKKRFLAFLTGTDRIPVMGMQSVKIKIFPCHLTEDDYPEANVCFFRLNLPEYTNAESLKTKLVRAINSKRRFDKL
uniref:probable E3 ubiquitin-protein ligase HERC6 n=1 Tax=Pristiophorus japonicus TaxID=55135 RepID=UPI00398EB717